MIMRPAWVSLIATLFASNLVVAQEADFNPYILRAISEVVEQRKGGGYDINKSFTRDLDYGNDIFRASGPPSTMCVAAIVEIIIEAMNLYAQDKGGAVFKLIPTTSWTKGHRTGLRANLYLYEGTGSRGTGHTLERFGLGKELRFSDLKSGDFVNFNRSKGSGHAVVFLGYLTPNGETTPNYSDDIIGFKYFSAQGKGKPDAGMAYRNAYFVTHCPPELISKGIRRDCDVIRSTNMALLNAGRMHDPSTWRYEQAVSILRGAITRGFEDAYPGQSQTFLDTLIILELNRDLQMPSGFDRLFDGVTTD